MKGRETKYKSNSGNEIIAHSPSLTSLRMTSKPDHKSVPWPAVEPSIFLPLKWLSLASTLLPGKLNHIELSLSTHFCIVHCFRSNKKILSAAGVYFCVAYTFTFGKEAISNLTLSSCPDVKRSEMLTIQVNKYCCENTYIPFHLCILFPVVFLRSLILSGVGNHRNSSGYSFSSLTFHPEYS